MQKRIILSVCLAMLLLLCACTATDRNTAQDTELQTTGYEAETVYLVENSEQNAICFAYPKLQYSESNAANDAILDFAQEKIAEICLLTDYDLRETSEKPSNVSANYQNTYLQIDYRITYCTEDTISVVFEGLYNYKKAAHPMHLLFTLNIIPQSGDRLAFADRYIIDDALYDTFAARAEKSIMENADETWLDGWGKFAAEICDKTAFLKGVGSEHNFHVFYTTEGIGISYPVPYSMGDHLEVIIPYSELTAVS